MGFWTSMKQIWTLARHTVLQAVRMKVVIVLVAFILILVPSLPFVLKGDDTLIGQIRMVLAYCTYLISFLLCILTVFLSASALNNEIRDKQILILDPKPVPRCVLLAGKLLGVLVINLALLAVMMGTNYGLVRWMGRYRPLVMGDVQKKIISESPEHIEKALLAQFEADVRANDTLHERLKTEVFSTLMSVRPEKPDFTVRIDAEIEDMKRRNAMPSDRTEEYVRQYLGKRIADRAWTVPPHGSQEWTIEGIPKFDGWLIIRFRHHGDRGVAGFPLPATMTVNEGGEINSVYQGPFGLDSQHFFAVPSNVVRDDGTVTIKFSNLSSNISAMFPWDGGIHVLYPVGPLWENFLRAGCMIALRLAFIAIVGVFASTFLSYPVAVLFTMVVFVVGHLTNFVLPDLLSELYIFGHVAAPGRALNPLDELTRNAIKYFFSVFPNFSKYDVASPLSNGYLITNKTIASFLLEIVLLRGGILAFAGWLIYRRRELAAVTTTS